MENVKWNRSKQQPGERRTVRVGLLGFGTVGSGVYEVIRKHQDKIIEHGYTIEIVKILVQDPAKKREANVSSALLTTDINDVLAEELDVLIECMGRVEEAYRYILAAFEKKCHVVTANKELLAKKGPELIRHANREQVHFYYEASVAGAIPILQHIRQLNRVNTIYKISGILNGTCNYILHQMEDKGLAYETALQEAQRLGFAEADPASDVEGFDTLYKVWILSQLCYGSAPQLTTVPRQGISGLTEKELLLAKKLGYAIRLLGQAEKKGDAVSLQVSPVLIAHDHPLCAVKQEFNGVQLETEVAGSLLFTGKGAGRFPTANAVVEDLLFLLQKQFQAQPEWQINAATNADSIEQNKSKDPLVFLYIEGSSESRSLSLDVLQQLDEEGVNLIQFQTLNEDHPSSDHALALITEELPKHILDQLQGQKELTVKQYPVLSSENRDAARKGNETRPFDVGMRIG